MMDSNTGHARLLSARGGRIQEDKMAVQTEAQQAFTARMLEKHITPLWTVASRS